MNRRALFIGLLYSVLVIIFKLFILLGGYTLTKFGFYYSNIIAVFLVLPFLFWAIYAVREKDRGGAIGGREAVRIGLTVVAVAAVIVSVYNYIEFDWKYKDIAVTYYNSQEYLDILKAQQIKNPDKLKPEQFPTIIKAQLDGLSAGRATTGRLFPLIFIGISGSFIAAVFMKRQPKL